MHPNVVYMQHHTYSIVMSYESWTWLLMSAVPMHISFVLKLVTKKKYHVQHRKMYRDIGPNVQA